MEEWLKGWLIKPTTLKQPSIEIEYKRPDWDTYFLIITKDVALRADCRRARHGAVITKRNRIVSTGYNGSPAGGPSCLAGACQRGLASYDTIRSLSGDYADCISCHAEQNAIAYANRSDTEGATIYITGEPCSACSKLIASAGITRTVF